MNDKLDKNIESRKPVTYVYERDIDLLLAEEFQASPEFQRWFAAMVANQVEERKYSLNEFCYVNHSVIG